MKTALFLVLVFMCFSTPAQIHTLFQASVEPKPGDIETGYVLDTAKFVSGLPMTAGVSKNWDFSLLGIFPGQFENHYVSPSTVSSSSLYPGCTVVQAQPGDVNYYVKSVTSPTPQTEALGFRAGTISIVLSNSAVMLRYPFTFGDTHTDNTSGTFTGPISGNCNGSVVTTADAYGTLVLPSGVTVSNVLRVKSVQFLKLTNTLFTLGDFTQTIYNYYSQSQKFPLLSINYSQLKFTTSPTPSVSAIVTGSDHVFTNIQKSDEEGVRFYPSPVQDYLNVEGVTADHLAFYTVTGQQLILPISNRRINLSTIPSGTYFIEIPVGNTILRKKFLKTY
jgi:hypothetical protein